MAAKRITTFYSYKGGVGRSMAVANLGVLLARAGRRVLVVDFDLDAPGLHRYFPATAGREPSDRPGVIDLFLDVRAGLERAFPGPGDFDPADGCAIATCRQLISSLLAREDLFEPIALAQDLTLLRAGRYDEGYADRVRTFDWKGLFTEFGEIFGLLREELFARYDDVLIDARTGLTDIGSISTVVLPDQLVVVFVPNEQSLAGGLEVARQAFGMHGAMLETKRASAPLRIIPLLCRVEPGEVVERSKWIKRAAEACTKLLGEIGGINELDLVRFFEDFHVPHSPYYAYGERIAVADDKDRGFGSIAGAYENIADGLLHAETLADWSLRNTSGALAMLVQFDARIELPSTWRFERVVRVPEDASVHTYRESLRRVPVDSAAWADAARAMDRAILEAIRNLRGSVHVFSQAPYPAAVLLGRRLDDLARSVPVHLYQYDADTRGWILFSSPERSLAGDERFFRELEDAATGVQGDGIIVAIEGFRPINDDVLRALARDIGAMSIARLRQRNDAPLNVRRDAMTAVRDVQRAFAQLQAKHPSARFHIVATSPVALLIELGRMLSPTVYRSAVVYQYHVETGSYAAAVDVVGMAARGLTSGSAG